MFGEAQLGGEGGAQGGPEVRPCAAIAVPDLGRRDQERKGPPPPPRSNASPPYRSADSLAQDLQPLGVKTVLQGIHRSAWP